MPEPYPDDLRAIAVEKVPAGESHRSVANQLRTATSTVPRWFLRCSDTGSAPSPMGKHRKPKLEGCQARMLDRVETCPAIILAGLRDLFGAGVSRKASPRSGAFKNPAASPGRNQRSPPKSKTAPLRPTQKPTAPPPRPRSKKNPRKGGGIG